MDGDFGHCRFLAVIFAMRPLQSALKVAITQRDTGHTMLASQLQRVLGWLDQTLKIGWRGHGDIAHLTQRTRHHMGWQLFGRVSRMARSRPC